MPGYTSTWNPGVTSSTPTSTPSYTGGGGGGQGPHWNPPPQEPDPVVTIAEVINEPISTGPPPGESGGPGYVAPPPAVEVWDEEDIDYLDGNLVSGMTPDEITEIVGDPYTPPEDIYGPGSAIPGETGYAYTNISPEMVLDLGLDQIDPETAAFFGYDPGSTTVPNELYQQYIQGSIVSGNEAVLSDESNIGTWHDLVAGEHPLFPGGLEDYYEDMNDPFTIPINMPGGGPSVPEQEQQQYGERRPSLAEMARNFWFSESLGDVEAKEAQREAEGLGPATMSNMDRMFAKDFAAEARQPDPFYDPEFSGRYYEDYDPIFAGMDLFERARG